MTTHPVTTTMPDEMGRAYAFTIATALAWVGHDCTGGCPPTTATMPASVWFIRRAEHLITDRTTTLVVVDLGGSVSEPAPVRAMLRQVNACTRADRIRLRERVSVDHGHALAALADPTSSNTGAVIYLRSEAAARSMASPAAPPLAPPSPEPDQVQRNRAPSPMNI